MPGVLGPALNLESSSGAQAAAQARRHLCQTALVPHMHVGTAPSKAGLLHAVCQRRACCKRLAAGTVKAPPCTLRGFPKHCLAEHPARSMHFAARTQQRNSSSPSTFGAGLMQRISVHWSDKLRHMSSGNVQRQRAKHRPRRAASRQNLRSVYMAACPGTCQACYVSITLSGRGHARICG